MGRTSRRSTVVLTFIALATAALQPAALLAASSPAPAHPDGKASVKLIVTYDGQPGKAAERAIARLGGTVKHHLKLVDGLAVELPPGQVQQLEKDPGVKAIEVDGRLTAFDHGPNTGDLEYENAWGVEHIGSRVVHLAGNTGQGVKVAIIDTGIDYIHDDPDDIPYVIDPEFTSNYKGGYDFYNNDADPYDDNGHGTHVAGILAAEHNGYLVTGVAPGVDLYALKVLSAAGEGDYSGLIAALGWAVAHDMDVVNMSLGGHEASAALQAAVAAAYDAGVTLVAASGNVNPGSFQELLYGCPVAYPAAYDQVIAVSFTNQADKLTGFSCTGTQVDLAAPGDQIFSPVPVGPTGSCMFCSPYGHSAQSGTSMASPHVAGVVALALHAGIADGNGNGLLADDIKAHLCANTSPAAGMATTDPRYAKWYGCGIVDADKSIVINPPPPPVGGPVAVADAVTLPEDGAADVAVLANDTEATGAVLTITAVTDPPHGSATINPDGTVHYVPDADYAGPDTFTYTIANPAAATATAPVAVTVTPVNDDPLAVDDSLVTTTGTAATIVVLANDTDVDGDPLTTTGAGTPAHGIAAIQPDGSITYVPAPGYAGADAFSYSISDGAGGSATGNVAVSVIDTNSPPVAVDDGVVTTEDTPAPIDVLANDTDIDGGSLSVSAVGPAAHGSTVIASDGRVVYTPSANYHGPDAFDYTVADQVGATDTGSVTIVVNPVNDAPQAGDDGANTTEDTAATIDVLANDVDVDGDALTVASVSAPAFGSTSIEPDGRVRYTPATNYSGADTFTYTVSDGAGGTDVATVSVAIAAVNDVPTAAPKTASTKYQTATTITLTGSDVETCDLTFQVVTPPGHGTLGSPSSVLCVTLLPPYADSSKIAYTPTAGYSGADSFTYRTSDGTAWSPPATVAITVAAPILVHAGDLDGSKTVQTTTWTAKVTIRAHDAAHANMTGVTVTGAWSGGASGTASCKTSSTGVCTVSKASIPKSTTSVTFTVTGMTVAAGAYAPAANHDPETDSTGTVIVVSGP